MKKFRSKKYIALVFVLLLSLSLAACSEKSATVATIGDEEISQDELNDVLVEKYGAETLNQLISERIVKKETDKADIEVTDEEVEAEYQNMANQYNGVEGLQAAIAQANLTEEDLKEDIKSNIALEKLLKPQVEASDEEIAAYYEENKDEFSQGEQVNASHILVEEEKEAQDIVKKLEDGEDFAALAKEYSIDEGTKENGGELGFFGRGEMVEEFDQVAFDLKKDEISEPIKSDFGYHIIEVHEKQDAKTISLDESKDKIKNILIETKMPETFSKWYSEKLEEYKVENKLAKKTEEGQE